MEQISDVVQAMLGKRLSYKELTKDKPVDSLYRLLIVSG